MTTDPLKHKLNSETAKIAWHDLQRFFASGVVLVASPELDLVDTALLLAKDNKVGVEALLKKGQLAWATDEQARHWFDNRSELWAVVVKPLILVQDTQ